MPIEGPLRELGIHDVFHLLDLGRETGVLTVTSRIRQNHGTVHFSGGAVVHAVIGSNPHPLGEVLLRAGRIAEADLQRARGMQHRGDERRLGEILMAIGALTRGELERYVRQQIAEVVFEIMNWREGYFSFAEGSLDDSGFEAGVRLPTTSLLLEAARRIEEWSRISVRIPSLGMVPVLAPAVEEPRGRLELLPAEWEVLAAIDGERDLRAIGRSLGRSDFDVCRTVFGLESAGVVALLERSAADDRTEQNVADLAGLLASAERELREGRPDAAEPSVDAALARSPRDPAVAVVRGRLHLARNEAVAAEQDFRRALRLDPLMAPAHRLLGDALARQGRLDEATEWWERWLTVSSHVSEVPEEADRVQEAIRAANTLDTFLRARP
jgi:tetratricopeptide (TPR) repeat protein